MSNAIKALANATKALKKEKQSLLAQIKLIDKALAGGSVTISSKPKKKKAKKKTAAQKRKQSLAMKRAWAKKKKK